MELLRKRFAGNFLCRRLRLLAPDNCQVGVTVHWSDLLRCNSVTESYGWSVVSDIGTGKKHETVGQMLRLVIMEL
jgi:hypothetical protein